MSSPDLFRSAAYYYARYRSLYPPKTIDDAADIFRLTKQDRIIDIGSGTGQLAIQLATRVGEVVAIEPDESMIEEGKKLAEQHKIDNIRWICAQAEDIDKISDLGTFKIATFGASFHWLNQDLVLHVLGTLIQQDGGIMITGAPSIWTATEPWEVAVKQTIQKYLGRDRLAGSGKFQQTVKKDGDDPYKMALEKSAFKNIEERHYSIARTKTVDEIIGNVYSTSFANPSLFGKKKDVFEKELGALLKELNPSGHFQKLEQYFAIFAKR